MKRFLVPMKILNKINIPRISSILNFKSLSIETIMFRAILVATVAMGFFIAFGNRGLVDNYMMKGKLTALKKVNQNILLENDDLKRNIILLRSNLNYIEMVARKELGMVRKGDIVYRQIQ